ncbi:hypothetical protein LINPERPRIM_LOCUS14692 [Linum perenne]
MATTPIRAGMEEATVNDLMILGIPEWDEELLHEVFDARDATIVSNLAITCYNKPDKLVWHYSKDGNYTVRSVYRLATERVVDKTYLHVHGKWQSLWQVAVPPKVKHFVWRLGR